MFGLIAVGSLLFWTALLIPFAILIALVENEESGWAAITTIATVAAGFMFLDRATVQAVLHNIIPFAAVYLAAGVVWGFVKWFFFILKIRDVYEKIRAEFLVRTNATVIDETNRDKFWSEITTRSSYLLPSRYHFNSFPPKASENKGRIVFWMAYWPASALWTILNDPLTRFYKMVFNRLLTIFEGISNKMFGKYANDFEK